MQFQRYQIVNQIEIYSECKKNNIKVEKDSLLRCHICGIDCRW